MTLARVLAGTAALLLFAPHAVAQADGAGSGSIDLNGFGTPVTQNFDTLAKSGSLNSLLPAGWYLREVATGSSGNYRASDGNNGTTDVYSFGSSSMDMDRAFGTLQADFASSVSIGVAFRNNTGSAIQSVSIGYTGEQWRLGATGRTDRLDFAYQVTAVVPMNFSLLASGTYVDFDPLDFTAPVTTGTPETALGGNVAENRTSVSATITGLNLANGHYLYLRWDDLNVSGAGDGLGIDNFSLTAHPVPEPAAVLGVAAGGLAVGAAVRHRLRRRV